MEVQQITTLLQEIESGRDGAYDDLMRLVYEDLERVAGAHLRRQFGNQAGRITLEPAALVNESFLRLIKQRSRFDNRGHFFAIASRIMLRVLIDYRRARNAAKRQGPEERVTLMLDEHLLSGGDGSEDVIEVEVLAEALDKLDAMDPLKADIVRMKVVWNMEIGEIASALEMSRSSIDRGWRFAKAWLADEVGLIHDP